MNVSATPQLETQRTALGAAPGQQFAPAPEDNIDLGTEIAVLENPLEVDKRLNRYIAFVGDVVIPQQKRDRRDLRIGGEYLGDQYKTLRRTKGLLRRCQITPMEIGLDFVGSEVLGANETGLQTVVSVTHGEGNVRGEMFGSKSIHGIEQFPGDEIKGIMRLNQHPMFGQRGIVELTNLIGVTVEDLQKSGLQNALIPGWRELMLGVDGAALPTTVRELVAQLETVRGSASGDLKELAEAYLISAEQYRNWGVAYLKLASSLVRLPANGGFVHTYSPLAEMLFEQLEVTPTDDILRNPAQPKAAASSEISASEMMALMARMVAVQESLAQRGVVSTADLAGVQMGAAAPAPEPAQPDHTDTRPNPVTTPTRPEVNPEIPEEPEVQPQTQVTQCTAITGTGDQCKRDAKPGTDRCEHPAHVR